MSTITPIYEKTPVGSTMLISATPEVIAGGGESAPHAHLERFAALVADLEALEQQGKVKIILRHRENQTGQQFVDLLRFQRLA
ncbi:hypothetical protein BKK81_33735 (plasmid) [Cupriavidus sp. USMAHM13]|uniref:hypothetical protein n=1 Tax=Cupriavidus sp. USMAHM13 TaxID=1389192 RepID=UPI0008A6CF34|nr:hypothetical protein [Cupriavidus sp. USMAHM13]AOZ04335.1 hypothetical protein BKK81_33735 [Cupriavidus sp. USMAHM13]